MAGKGEQLKEYLIGSEVYDRRPPYDPTVDSIVRTEARRLRSKVKLYYETEGKYNPLRIHFDVGNYVPSFVERPTNTQRASLPLPADTGVVDEIKDVLIDVAPFRDLARTTLSAAFARGLSQEIAQVLMRRGVCSVMEGNSRQNTDCMRSAEPVPLSPDFRLEGSIREAEGGLSVMVKLIRPT
jgi:TolB-like protein